MDTNKLRLIVCISIIFNFQFSIFNSSRAQWWTGWSQKTSLALCLHQTDSTYELYSPLQFPEPIAVTRWSLSGDTLRLECASIGLKMTLKRCSPSPTTPTSCSPSQTPPTSCSPSQGELSEGLRGWQGTWRQGLLRETITLLPADTLYQLRRPQTPQHCYTEETLTVDYVDSHGDSIHLEGTLTLSLGPTSTELGVPQGTASHPTSTELSVPRGTASRTTQPLSPSATPLPHPCLMLVSGSGQQNRDEELFHHRPFLVLADYLAAHGIATFRYDDRGVGASTGPIDSATTLTFAEDAEALFNALKRHPAVDTRRLGIGGHSEGAAIAPIIAARNKDVKYVVMLAGQGCSGLDVMVQQNEALFRSRGVSPRLSALRAACMREIFEAYTTTPPSHSATQSPIHSTTQSPIHSTTQSPSHSATQSPIHSTTQSPSHSATQSPSHSTKDLQAIILRHTDGLTKEEIDSIELRKGMAYAIKQQLDLPWMQTFLTLDPASYLPKVKVPLLALGGDRDCQVLAEPNLQRIKQLCPQAETHTLQGLNHLFQHCTTGAPDEYIQIEETFAPEALRHILDFLLGPTRLPANTH